MGVIRIMICMIFCLKIASVKCATAITKYCICVFQRFYSEGAWLKIVGTGMYVSFEEYLVLLSLEANDYKFGANSHFHTSVVYTYSFHVCTYIYLHVYVHTCICL